MLCQQNLLGSLLPEIQVSHAQTSAVLKLAAKPPPPPKVVVEEAVLGETLQVCPRKPFLLYCLSNALY